MYSKGSAVCCDLDSTLFNTEHRHHLSPLTNPDATWESYADACDKDSVFEGTATLLRLLYPYYQIHLVSGRSDNARRKTRDVLADYHVPYDYLCLRREGDRRHNGKLKVDYIKDLQLAGVRVELFLEDWKEAAEKITRKTGVPCLLVNPGYAWIEEKKSADGIGGGL